MITAFTQASIWYFDEWQRTMTRVLKPEYKEHPEKVRIGRFPVGDTRPIISISNIAEGEKIHFTFVDFEGEQVTARSSVVKQVHVNPSTDIVLSTK